MSGVMTFELEFGVLAFVARIPVAAARTAHVEPGPAVEAVLLDVGDVVGDEVVAQGVALVGGAPELAGDGVDGLAHAVANAPGVDLDEFAFGGELEHVGAVKFFGVGVGVVDVGVRADGGEELCAIEREGEVAGPVAAAAQASAAGQVGDLLHGAASGEIAIAVGEAHDAVGVADIDPLRVGAEGIEGDAEGLVEIAGEDGGLFGIAVGVDAAKDFDFARSAFGEEEVAVGGEADEAGVVEIGGIELDLEAFGRDGPGVGGTGNDGGTVVDGLAGRGLGQVGDGEMAADAGGFVSRVSEGGLASEDGMRGGGLRGVGGRGARCSSCGDSRNKKDKAGKGRGGEQAMRIGHVTSQGDELRLSAGGAAMVAPSIHSLRHCFRCGARGGGFRRGM